MNFRSDNEASAHPRILEAVVQANAGTATAYAEDEYSARLDEAFGRLFDTECRVLPMATGTAANAVTLSAMTPPWGAVMCHQRAHIANDEGGAPEFYCHGAKLTLLDGAHGRLDAAEVASAIDAAGVHGVHNVKPSAVSITQATECGTCYRPDDIAALSEAAHSRGLPLHMDGARFANAVAWLGCAPADVTWRVGVDALSFGATKNGALAAEAIVVFGHPEWLEPLERMRKRGGHLLSKMRYVSAQLLAMLEDGLWLDLAARANAAAARLAGAIEASPVARLHWPVEANEVFMQAPPRYLDALAADGFAFHVWPGHDDIARLVCAHETTDQAVDQLAETIGSWK